MKKLISGVFITALMASGMVAATSAPAAAGCAPTQYSGCVDTRTNASASGVVAKGKRARLCAKVNTKASNATAVGRVVFKVKRNQGGYFSKSSEAYSGGKVCASTRRLTKTGGYVVVAKFKSPKGSIFQNSRGAAGFDVAS